VEKKRMEYIQNALLTMGPELETRFEFYIRSHFNAKVRRGDGKEEERRGEMR